MEISGRGLSGLIGDEQINVGNLAYMLDLNIDVKQYNEIGTLVYVAKNNEFYGVIVINDQIKEYAVETINQLKKLNIKTIMLTGDNQKVAMDVANKVKIDECYSELLPQDKVNKLKELIANENNVAFVGDGINDAPALVSADVGIAMGDGTEVAIESADLTFLTGRLSVLAETFSLANASMRNIKQNLFGAFIYNSLGIPVAAGVLFPLSGMLLSPVIAGAAMALSSLTVVTNANRLRHVKLTR